EMEILEDPRPPVRSSSSGASAAFARDSSEAREISWEEISSGSHTWIPAASAAGIRTSLPPIREVPETQPILACAKVTPSGQPASADHLAKIASKAALTSP